MEKIRAVSKTRPAAVPPKAALKDMLRASLGAVP
jgi:hypothetical protein